MNATALLGAKFDDPVITYSSKSVGQRGSFVPVSLVVVVMFSQTMPIVFPVGSNVSVGVVVPSGHWIGTGADAGGSHKYTSALYVTDLVHV